MRRAPAGAEDQSDTYAYMLLPEEEERRMRASLGSEPDRLLRPIGL
jgi:hypothetical protein